METEISMSKNESYIRIRCPKEMKMNLKKLAKENGVKFSELVRAVLKTEIKELNLKTNYQKQEVA